MHNGNELKGFQRLQEYISKKSKITNASILSGQKAAAEYLQEAMRGRSAPRGRSSPHMLDTFMFEQDETTAETKFGWSRFYGRMVESGHKVRPPGKRKKKAGEQRTVKAQPHIIFQTKWKLTLSLFVLRVFTDDSDASLSFDNFALLANRFN